MIAAGHVLAWPLGQLGETPADMAGRFLFSLKVTVAVLCFRAWCLDPAFDLDRSFLAAFASARRCLNQR